MSEPVRAALVGAGLVGQVAHLHTLTLPESPIRLAGVVDASESRARTIGEANGVPYATSLTGIPRDELDAVVIAAPDPAHRGLVLQALSLGLHVFVEKPLALDAAEASELVAAADRSGLVCQVGYMKRFDPAPRLLLADLARRGARITGVAVEVRDPDAAPFIRDFPMVHSREDVPVGLIAEGRARFSEAVASVLGRPGTEVEETTYASYISALVHDLNLARMLVPGPYSVEAGYAAMEGLEVGMHLRTTDGCLIRMTHTQDPRIADYEERFTVYTDAGVYVMIFPAPYLLHATTTLHRIDVKDDQERSAVIEINDSTDEAFILELRAFAEAVSSGASQPIANPFSEACEDLGMLGEAFRMSCRTP